MLRTITGTIQFTAEQLNPLNKRKKKQKKKEKERENSPHKRKNATRESVGDLVYTDRDIEEVLDPSHRKPADLEGKASEIKQQSSGPQQNLNSSVASDRSKRRDKTSRSSRNTSQTDGLSQFDVKSSQLVQSQAETPDNRPPPIVLEFFKPDTRRIDNTEKVLPIEERRETGDISLSLAHQQATINYLPLEKMPKEKSNKKLKVKKEKSQDKIKPIAKTSNDVPDGQRGVEQNIQVTNKKTHKSKSNVVETTKIMEPNAELFLAHKYVIESDAYNNNNRSIDIPNANHMSADKLLAGGTTDEDPWSLFGVKLSLLCRHLLEVQCNHDNFSVDPGQLVKQLNDYKMNEPSWNGNAVRPNSLILENNNTMHSTIQRHSILLNAPQSVVSKANDSSAARNSYTRSISNNSNASNYTRGSTSNSSRSYDCTTTIVQAKNVNNDLKIKPDSTDSVSYEHNSLDFSIPVDGSFNDSISREVLDSRNEREVSRSEVNSTTSNAGIRSRNIYIETSNDIVSNNSNFKTKTEHERPLKSCLKYSTSQPTVHDSDSSLDAAVNSSGSDRTYRYGNASYQPQNVSEFLRKINEKKQIALMRHRSLVDRLYDSGSEGYSSRSVRRSTADINFTTVTSLAQIPHKTVCDHRPRHSTRDIDNGFSQSSLDFPDRIDFADSGDNISVRRASTTTLPSQPGLKTSSEYHRHADPEYQMSLSAARGEGYGRSSSRQSIERSNSRQSGPQTIPYTITSKQGMSASCGNLTRGSSVEKQKEKLASFSSNKTATTYDATSDNRRIQNMSSTSSVDKMGRQNASVDSERSARTRGRVNNAATRKESKNTSDSVKLSARSSDPKNLSDPLVSGQTRSSSMHNLSSTKKISRVSTVQPTGLEIRDSQIQPGGSSYKPPPITIRQIKRGRARSRSSSQTRRRTISTEWNVTTTTITTDEEIILPQNSAIPTVSSQNKSTTAITTDEVIISQQNATVSTDIPQNYSDTTSRSDNDAANCAITLKAPDNAPPPSPPPFATSSISPSDVPPDSFLSILVLDSPAASDSFPPPPASMLSHSPSSSELAADALLSNTAAQQVAVSVDEVEKSLMSKTEAPTVIEHPSASGYEADATLCNEEMPLASEFDVSGNDAEKSLLGDAEVSTETDRPNSKNNIDLLMDLEFQESAQLDLSPSDEKTSLILNENVKAELIFESTAISESRDLLDSNTSAPFIDPNSGDSIQAVELPPLEYNIPADIDVADSILEVGVTLDFQQIEKSVILSPPPTSTSDSKNQLHLDDLNLTKTSLIFDENLKTELIIEPTITSPSQNEDWLDGSTSVDPTSPDSVQPVEPSLLEYNISDDIDFEDSTVDGTVIIDYQQIENSGTLSPPPTLLSDSEKQSPLESDDVILSNIFSSPSQSVDQTADDASEEFASKKFVLPKMSDIVESLKFETVDENSDAPAIKIPHPSSSEAGEHKLPVADVTVFEYGEMISFYKTENIIQRFTK